MLLVLVLVLVLAVVVVGVVSGLAYRSLVQICLPTEFLVFSGRRHVLADGRTVGYRVVLHGRSVKVPVIETVDRMDTSPIRVPIAVRNTSSSGGSSLDVHAVASIKISTDARLVDNAIERFLGRDRHDIARAADQTLEGQVRGLVAAMTADEVRDRVTFTRQLESAARPDLAKLGLELVSFELRREIDAACFQRILRLACDQVESGFRDSAAPFSIDDAGAIVRLARPIVDGPTFIELARQVYAVVGISSLPVMSTWRGERDTQAAAQLCGKPAGALAYIVAYLVATSDHDLSATTRARLDELRIALELDDQRASELVAATLQITR